MKLNPRLCPLSRKCTISLCCGIFRANVVFGLDVDLLAVLQQKLAQMLSKLMKMAEEFNVAVFMTNHGLL